MSQTEGGFPHSAQHSDPLHRLFVKASRCCQPEGKSTSDFSFTCCMCSHCYSRTGRGAVLQRPPGGKSRSEYFCWGCAKSRAGPCTPDPDLALQVPSCAPFPQWVTRNSRVLPSLNMRRLCHFIRTGATLFSGPAVCKIWISGKQKQPDLCYHPLPSARWKTAKPSSFVWSFS